MDLGTTITQQNYTHDKITANKVRQILLQKTIRHVLYNFVHKKYLLKQIRLILVISLFFRNKQFFSTSKKYTKGRS
jgi:hypothetical protein